MGDYCEVELLSGTGSIVAPGPLNFFVETTLNYFTLAWCICFQPTCSCNDL